MDITKTGKKITAKIEGETVEYLDLMEWPSYNTSPASMKVRKYLNPVDAAYKLYGDAEDWWKLLAFTPYIMYPPDLDQYVGERLPVVSS
jgi:hypothetical protein